MVGSDDGCGVLEVVDHARDRSACVIDRERMEHQAEDAVPVGQRPQLLVPDVPRVVVHSTAGGMGDEHGRVAAALEHLGEERRRGMCEIEDHSQAAEPVDVGVGDHGAGG